MLKNQGEGGGHCLFDQDILHRLDTLGESDYAAWTLMQRLHPAGRDKDTLLVRDGRARTAQRLVSEIGLFTAHLGSAALDTDAISDLAISAIWCGQNRRRSPKAACTVALACWILCS